MTKEQKQLKAKLTIVFWTNITVLIAAIIALLHMVGIDGQSTTEQDFMMERFGIIVAIITIPLSLKFFHQKYKKAMDQELSIFLKKLYTLFNARLAALSIVVILNLIGFYFIGALNFMYMAGITILAFALCYPTESLIDPIEKNIEPEDE